MTLTVKISMAWWFTPYVRTLQFFSLITGMTPDFDKLDKVIRHAIRVEGPVKHG